MTYTAKTLNDNSIWYFVVYSPRGFYNETTVTAFMNEHNAETFASEVNNDVDAYTLSAERAEPLLEDWDGENVLMIWNASEVYPD